MLTKEQFMKLIRQETDICKHLYSKIPEGGLDYRPTEGQRSTLELLQYLTGTVISPAKGLVNNDWSHLRADLDAVGNLSAEDFCAAMDRQADETEKLLESVSEEDFCRKETTTPVGMTELLGPALVDLCIRFFSAYKMQLFLYLKSAGASELSSFNCWMGMDKPESMSPHS